MLLQTYNCFCHHSRRCSHLPLNLRRLSIIVSSSGPIIAIVEESHTTRTTAIIATAVNLARLCFYRYHYDHLAPIYSIVEVLQPSKPSHTLTCRPGNLHESARLTRLLLLQANVTRDVINAMSALAYINIQSPAYVSCLCHLVDVIFVDFYWQALVNFDRWLFAWLTVDFNAIVDFLQSRCSLSNFLRRFHFYSPFLHIVLLNEE